MNVHEIILLTGRIVAHLDNSIFNVEDAGVFQYDKEYKDLTPEKVSSCTQM